MTGSEIEQAFVEGMYQGFAENKEPDVATIRTVIETTMPLASTMAEQVEALRKWAESRARWATSQKEKGPGGTAKELINLARNN